MLHQEMYELLDLLRHRETPVIVAPDVLGQVPRQALAPNAALGRQPALEVAPEALQAVDVPAPAIAELALAVGYEPVDIALGRDARVAEPGVRTDDRAASHSSTNQWQQGLGLHIGHDLRPDLAAPAEDAEDRRLGRAAAPLGAGATFGPPLVLPRAPEIGLVDLDGTAKARRHLLRHRVAQDGQGPQHSGLGQRQRLADRLGTEALHMASQQGAPVMPCHSQRQAGPPFVAAPRAASFPSTDDPGSGVRASRAAMPSGHAGILTLSVA